MAGLARSRKKVLQVSHMWRFDQEVINALEGAQDPKLLNPHPLGTRGLILGIGPGGRRRPGGHGGACRRYGQVHPGGFRSKSGLRVHGQLY